MLPAMGTDAPLGPETSHRFVEQFLTLFGGRRFDPPVSLQAAASRDTPTKEGHNM